MVKNSKALLTIIVPAYNVENYIAECLDSLVDQTMQNHKIIIVNDGSTDKTPFVCLEYQKKYPELITYISQENQGLGEARNAGLRKADTPYVGFLDSDDWLDRRYVECFSRLIEETDEQPELVFTLPWVYDTATNRIFEWKDKELYDRIFEVKDGVSRVQTNCILKPELYGLEVTACRKLYKRDFLKRNSFAFPNHLKWEDVPGHFYLLHRANTCIALPEVGFRYRVNQGDQITTGGGASRLDMIPIFRQLLEIQEKERFEAIERAYVLRVIVDFSAWSIDVTNQQYIKPLLEGLHSIFVSFPKNEIDYYLDRVSGNRDWERGLISTLAGARYLELADYEDRDQVIWESFRREMQRHGKPTGKKNIISGGIQCVCDHGLSYTLIWAFRKYILREGKVAGDRGI